MVTHTSSGVAGPFTPSGPLGGSYASSGFMGGPTTGHSFTSSRTVVTGGPSG